MGAGVKPQQYGTNPNTAMMAGVSPFAAAYSDTMGMFPQTPQVGGAGTGQAWGQNAAMQQPEDPWGPGNQSPFDPPPEVIIRNPGGRRVPTPPVGPSHGGTVATNPAGGPVSDATPIGDPWNVGNYGDVDYTPSWMQGYNGGTAYPPITPVVDPGLQQPNPAVPQTY